MTTSSSMSEEAAVDGGASFSAFMSEIEAQLGRIASETSKAPATLYEHTVAFGSAIDWSEHWIRCLLAFHVLCLCVSILFRKNMDVQTVLFVILSALVYFAERINSYCSVNWRLFSKQNYFDKAGVFAGIVFSAPLLCICFIQLVSGESSSSTPTSNHTTLIALTHLRR